MAVSPADLLRFEAAVGRLRSLPSREQELRARAERAEAEVAKMQKAAVGDASSTPEESMVARMAEMHNAVESEQTRWQCVIYEHLCNSLPDGCLDTCIDGGGCDSSDPLEFTTSEISCAITAWASQAERAERQLAEAHYEIDRLKPRWGLLDLLAEARRMAGEQWQRAWIAEEKYRWMVEHAADQRLDGYRELGDRAACAENARDAAIAECERLRAAHPADIGGLAQLLARVEKADAEVERLRVVLGWLVFERTVQTRCGCPQCTMSVGAVADEDGLVGDCAIKKLLTGGVEGPDQSLADRPRADDPLSRPCPKCLARIGEGCLGYYMGRPDGYSLGGRIHSERRKKP